MHRFITLAVAGLLATLTLAAPAENKPKSCPCYIATVTTTPEICPMCIPAQCLVYPTITTTIPGPNPTCTQTATHTVSKPCPCGGDWCPTAWATKTGAFTCKRGGTKETNIAGGPVAGGDAEPVVTESATLPDAGTTGIMSILPIETSAETV